MGELNGIDYLVMASYFCLLVGLALYLKRRASSSIEDYFLGGRKLPWWALGISGMASWLDVTGTSLIVAFLYMLGPKGLYVEIRGSVGIIMVFMLLWAGKWHRRSQCMTGAEWMVYRFGEGLWGQFARLSSAMATILVTVGMLAVMIKGVGTFFSTFLPFSPLTCSIVMIGIATIYTILSGFYGVVFTDMIQAVIIMLAVIVVSIIACGQIHSFESFSAIAQKVTSNPEWTSSKLSWKANMPEGYKQYSSLGIFILFYLFRNVIAGMGSGGDPKYFGAKNDRECGLLSFLWTSLMTFRWPLAMAFAIIGICMINKTIPDQSGLAQATELIQTYAGPVEKVDWPNVVSAIMHSPEKYSVELIQGLRNVLGEDWSSSLRLLSYEGGVFPEKILPAAILYKVPFGLRGLIIVALIAASMSTFDSTLNACSGYFVKDIYQRYIRRHASNKELIRMSYLFSIFVVLAAFGMAYTTTSINDIWGWVVMGLGGGFIVPGALRFYWWRFNGGGFAIGTIVGMIAAVMQRLTMPELDERMQFILLLGVGTVASIVGTYLTKPTDKETIEHFYKTTRPFGVWGKKFKALLSDELRVDMEKEHKFDLISVPFVMCWQVTLYLLPMQLLIRDFRSFGWTLVIFVVSLTGMYFFWYKKLPSNETSIVEELVFNK